MEYTKIELKGYKRLQLNNIQLIRMEPRHLIQLILGTNGSGKSSLLREITPLPSHHTQYEKDGYKLLEMNHAGYQYVSIQRFNGKGGEYQLLKNGTDIFIGSTTADYRSLIKDEFGITPEIQTLIDGVVRFSTMDVSKRRHWITLLSHADYTYAIDYYKKLRTRIRDLQGSLSVSQNRFAIETSKILSDEDILKIREQLKLYQESIHHLLELKPRVPLLRSDLERFLVDKDNSLEIYQKRLMNVRQRLARTLSDYWITNDITLERAQQELYRFKGTLENLHTSRIELTKNLEEQIQQINKSVGLSLFSVQELQQQQRVLLESLHKLEKIPLVYETQHCVSSFISAIESIYDNLSWILEQLPAEGLKGYGRHELEHANHQHHQTSDLLRQVQNQIRLDQTQIADMDHAKIHHQRECPKCHHQWFHGYNETRYQALQNTISKNVERETELTASLARTEERLSDLKRVHEFHGSLVQIMRTWPILKPFWELLQTGDEGFKPKEARRTLESIRQNTSSFLQADIHRTEIKRLDELIKLAEQQSEIDHDYQQKLLEETETELVQIQEKIRYHEENIRTYEVLISLFKAVEELSTSIQTELQERDQHVTYLQDSLRVEHINRVINIFRQEVSILEQTISKIDIQSSLLEQLKNQISEHEKDIALLKMAEQALSPASGLIAKGLTGFINWFIASMNQFVKHIWTYPLEILPMEIKDEVELDYKFPVVLDHRSRAADVKVGECNQSTCDIFDLAFRIVAMGCLGLKNWPLQLDEFGASFDASHRNAAFQVVTNLVTTTDIPQIFLVSHAEQSYGSLRNADITVLHDDNIVLPNDAVINGRTTIN